MTEPVKIITFGGAKFDENQVSHKSTYKKGNETRYLVIFKGGASVEYPNQAAKNNSKIDIGRDESYLWVGKKTDSKENKELFNNKGKLGYEDISTDKTGTIWQKGDKFTISQFCGLEFHGSDWQPDDVVLEGCTKCTVDVSGGNSHSMDRVKLKDTSKFASQKNEVKIDNKDLISDNNAPAGKGIIEGAGVYREGDSKDKLKNN